MYDSDKFRNYLHLTVWGFLVLASFFDLFVIYYSNYMKHLYDEDYEDEQKPESEEMANLNQPDADRQSTLKVEKAVVHS